MMAELIRAAGFAWLLDLENEWLTWTGVDGEAADQIDAAAYAAGHTVSACQQLIIPAGLLSGWAGRRRSLSQRSEPRGLTALGSE